MKKIQWKKGEWIKKGAHYRLDRMSKCKKYIIHKWENENNYFISAFSIYLFYIPVTEHGELYLFSSLKQTKEFINNNQCWGWCDDGPDQSIE